MQKILAAFLKKNNKKMLALVAAVIAAVIVIFLVVGLFNRVDVADYIIVKTADAFEGSGFAEISLDYVALAEKLEFENQKDIRSFRDLEEEGLADLAYLTESEENRQEIEEEYGLNLGELYELGKAISISSSNSDALLSNGDIIEITIQIQKGAKFKKKLKGGKMEHTVSRLKTLFAAEPLVIPSFYGPNGSGKITAHASLDPSYGDWVDDISFDCSVSANETLSNGDVITVTATIKDYEAAKKKAMQYGYSLKETNTVELVVCGLVLE